jgi:hypothetical protein
MRAIVPLPIGALDNRLIRYSADELQALDARLGGPTRCRDAARRGVLPPRYRMQATAANWLIIPAYENFSTPLMRVRNALLKSATGGLVPRVGWE